MGAVMAVIMLGFMWGMYQNRTFNLVIVGGSVIAFALALWLVRSQETVDDVSWRKAMIPHQSIAIMAGPAARRAEWPRKAKQRQNCAHLKIGNYILDVLAA